jgi:hypothetical protein
VAAHGKRQRPEPPNRDRPAALEAETVPACIETSDRVVDADESGRAHFDQREFQCDVDIGVGSFSLIDHLKGSIGPAVAHAIVNVALQPGFEFTERASQFGCPNRVVATHKVAPAQRAPATATMYTRRILNTMSAYWVRPFSIHADQRCSKGSGDGRVSSTVTGYPRRGFRP